MASTFVFAIFLTTKLLEISPDFDFRDLIERPALPTDTGPKLPPGKCGLPKPCPEGQFAFKISSGAANVVGPKICLEGKMLMDGLKNNVGNGINIAVVNGQTGELKEIASFNMWNGEIGPLIKFLKSMEDGSLVLMASYDDPATKLNKEARKLIGDLGSTYVTSLGFRDNWVFVGGKGTKTKSPFEKHIKNDMTSNMYDNWPERIQVDGCIPRKLD